MSKMNFRIMNTMMQRAAAVLAVLLVLGVAKLSAQPNAQQTTQQNTPQTSWDDELRYAREENLALKNIMSAIQSIDTARQSELIQYIITDRSIRSRVISALRKAGKTLPPNSDADLVVTQKPGTRDALISGNYQDEVELLRIIIGEVGIYGAPTIRRILGEDLYNKINSRADFEYTLVSTPSAQQHIQYADINASLYGGDITFKSGFGIGMVVGNDYIGYPFWQAGNIAVQGIIHKEMTDARFGLNFQLGDAGIQPFSISGGLNIKQRNLEGTQGFNASIDQILDIMNDKNAGKLGIGGEIFEAFTPTINTFSARAGEDLQYRTDYGAVGGTTPISGVKKDSLNYLSFSAHAWVSYAFGGKLRGAYAELGGGAHRVDYVTVGEKGTKFGDPGYSDLITAKTFDRTDLLVKLGYKHTGTDGYDWGISLQYCNTLMADGFLQIFSWLDLEAKYSTIVFRNPDKWELQDFVMISPVLHLNF